MELFQLRYFIAAAETGSFADASNGLFVSRQALSKGIRDLEREWGTTLFARNKTGTSLTSTGEYAYPLVKQILSQIDGIGDKIYEFEGRRKSVLKIMFSQCILPEFSDRIEKYIKANPMPYEVVILSGLEAQCKQALKDNKVDCICISNTMNDDSLVSTVVYEAPLYVLMNRDNPLCRKESVTREDLLEQNLIVLDPETYVASTAISILKKSRNSDNNQIIYTDIDYFKAADMLVKNKGVLIFSEIQLSRMKLDVVEQRPLMDKDFKYKVYLNVSKSNPYSDYLSSFCRSVMTKN